MKMKKLAFGKLGWITQLILALVGMGTQVHYKSYYPGYFSMRDLNEESNSSSWPLFYGDKTSISGQYYNGHVPRVITDACPGYDKDDLKRKILEHEAIFKDQVYELHRLYRIQRDMMEEIRRKELHKRQMSIEPSSSSSLLGSQMQSEDAGKWHISSFPLANSSYPKPSVSGAEIINSPLSCTKGKNAQAGQVNGSTSKDCEVLEVRPSKVRKKLFDLQLPADEYIDTDTEEWEQLCDEKLSDISRSLPNGDDKTPPENRKKKFVNDGLGEKLNHRRDTPTSESCFRSMRLADLNEPVQLEEGLAPSMVEFLATSSNGGENKAPNVSPKPISEFLDLQKEIMHNSHRGNQSGNVNHISVGNKGNERHWFSAVHESGYQKNNFTPVPQGLQQDQLPLPSQPAELVPFKGHQSPSVLPNDHGRDEFWSEKTGRGMETLDRIRDKSKYNNLDSVMTSQVPTPYAFVNSSDFRNSWSHSALSWAKPTSSLTEKLSSFDGYPSLNSSVASSKNSKPAQSQGILGEKWHVSGNSRLNPGLSDSPIMNGFYHGFSSGSKEMLARHSSVSLSRLNCYGNDNAASSSSLNHGPEDLHKDYNCIKPAKDMDLNVVHVDCSMTEAVSHEDVEVVNEKRNLEDHLAALPWLRSKPASKNEAANARRDSKSQDFGSFKASPDQLLQESEPVKDLNKKFAQKVIPIPSDSENDAKKEVGEAQSIKKILGFPIFEKPPASGNETSLPVSPSVILHRSLSGQKVETEEKIRAIDINLACDEEIASEVPTVEEEFDSKIAHIKSHIDLNLCVGEDEDPLATSVANSACMRIAVDIDLEAPVLETEDDILYGEEHKQPEALLKSLDSKDEEAEDEVVRMAAEAITLLSTLGRHIHMKENTCQPSEVCLAEPLLWLAEVVSSHPDPYEISGGKELKGLEGLLIGNYSSDELDDFEVMTLQLQETKEEDYMPKPFVPEVQKIEELGVNSVPNRPRKGQTRRGRQRRDFQRDILPGLASLSRHEVTEDLQTFGGLMRATGHPWNSGLTRRNGTRNGGARGRQKTVVDTASAAVATAACTPLMHQLTNIEAGLEDRSLTGWGKTTRRPRRQRYPAGNPPTLPLT